jgi:hypothetical protein
MNENDINEATKCRFASYKAGVYSHRFGKYILPNGRELLIFGTMQGDGTFPGEQRFTDSDGHVYVIDTCAIGITLVEGMPTEFLKRGRIVDFEHEFTCSVHTLQHPQGGAQRRRHCLRHETRVLLELVQGLQQSPGSN